jgi:hypothetical protein
MSQPQCIIPQTSAEIEAFAHELGRHAKKFSNEVAYRGFLQDLVAGLSADLNPPQVSELAAFIYCLATKRTKEERPSTVTPAFVESDDSADQDLFTFM